jgi:hypothetical protein
VTTTGPQLSIDNTKENKSATVKKDSFFIITAFKVTNLQRSQSGRNDSYQLDMHKCI